MRSLFNKLNDGWNAEPNAPMPEVVVIGNDLELRFCLNHFLDKRFSEGQIGLIRFRECSQWRLARPTMKVGMQVNADMPA
jgi:hypothetical protein